MGRGGILLSVEQDEEILGQLIKKADLLINATPLGMTPDIESMAIDSKLLFSELMVMDLVYNPQKTKLLREAEKAGCKAVEGLDMLVHQGAESLRIWLEIDAPIDVMREAAQKALEI